MLFFILIHLSYFGLSEHCNVFITKVKTFTVQLKPLQYSEIREFSKSRSHSLIYSFNKKTELCLSDLFLSYEKVITMIIIQPIFVYDFTGHGLCVSYDVCQCEHNWLGEDCSEADCRLKYNCSSQGECVTPNNCDCFDGYQGIYCSQVAEPNLYTPIFDENVYEITLQENCITPLYLLTVIANDYDSHRNGEVLYLLDPTGLPVNVNLYFALDSVTGELILLKPINSKHTKDGNFYVTILAIDRGVPSKSAKSSLKISIIEENDHCPIMWHPTVNKIIYFNISSDINTTVVKINATDNDRGKFGELSYILSNQLDVPFLDLDKSDGRLYLSADDSAYITGEHAISVTVMDNSVNPCAITCTFLVVIVDGQYIPTTPAPLLYNDYGETTHSISTVDSLDENGKHKMGDINDNNNNATTIIRGSITTPITLSMAEEDDVVVHKNKNVFIVTVISVFLAAGLIVATVVIVVLLSKLKQRNKI